MPRPSLLGRLTAASRVPVVALVAPPGYGKTTVLAQWVEQDPRPFVWLSVDQHDNDPAVLLTYLAVALDRVEAVDPAVFDALAAPGTSVLATVVPRLGAALATAAHPLVVVIDDIQLLHNQECLDALMMLVDHLGEGSQLVVAGRGAPRLPVARLRAEGRVVELGPEALAMDRHEAGALLQAAELQLSDAEVAELVRRTEGWPVALYLAALSMKATGSKPGAAAALGGGDRFLVDYAAVGAAVWPAAGHGAVPDAHGGAGSAVGAAVRRHLGHHRVGRDPGAAGAVEPAGDPAGRPTAVVPLPPPVPGAAAGRAGTPRARAGRRAYPAGGRLV